MQVKNTTLELEKEKLSVLDRLTCPKKQMDKTVRDRFTQFVTRVAKKVNYADSVKQRSLYPPPSVSSCYEQSRMKGGVTTADVLNTLDDASELIAQNRWYNLAFVFIKTQVSKMRHWRHEFLHTAMSRNDPRQYDFKRYPFPDDDHSISRTEQYPDGTYDEVEIIEGYLQKASILLELVIGARAARRKLLKRLRAGEAVQLLLFDPLRWGPKILVEQPDRSFVPVTTTLAARLGVPETRRTQTSRDICENSIRLLHEAEGPFKCKIQIIEEFQGKLRSVTIHEAALVQCARMINNLVLPILERLTTSADLLSGRNIKITRAAKQREKIIAYSADLSKATDEMNQPDTQHILEHLLTLAGAPRRMVECAKYLTNPQVITHLGDKTLEGVHLTTVGALMGLGPGWTVLSLLNTFAAVSAGIKPNSFRVCGDDLVALCTEREADRYEANLRKLRLVPNVKKSFRGDHAVFCEMHCLLDTRKHKDNEILYTLMGSKEVRIAQAAGTKLLSGGSRTALKAIAQTDELLDMSRGVQSRYYKKPHRLISSLMRRTAMAIGIGTGGALKMGGGGRGKINRTTFNMYVKHGVFSTTQKRRTSSVKSLVDEATSFTSTTEGVDRKKLIVELTTGQSQLDQCQGQWRRSETKKTQTIRKLWKARYNSCSRINPFLLTKDKLERGVQGGSIRPEHAKRVKGKVYSYLRRGNYARAIKTFQKIPSLVSTENAIAILKRVPMSIGVISPDATIRQETLRGQRLE